MSRPFIFNKPIIYPPDPVPVQDPRPQNFEIANAGGGLSPEVLTYHYLTDDAGNILYDDSGNPLIADLPPNASPPEPTYLTDELGNILFSDSGERLTTDDSAPIPPIPPLPAFHPAGCFVLPGPPMPAPQPLPWPIYPIGPPLPCPTYLTDDAGNILYSNTGYPLVTDDSAPQPPPIPVFVTSPLPPLPDEIEWTEP